MSKLGDKIRKVTRLEAQPLGFVTARATKDATLVLVGVARDAAAAADLVKRGADAVLVESDNGNAPADGIAGGWIRNGRDAGGLKTAGYDFAVFDPDVTPSTAVLEEEIGYVLVLPGDIGDVELRAIESFQLDAIDVGSIDGALSVRKQIDLRRIFALTRKPLMATVPANISVEQLQALRDTNVTVVGAKGGDDVEKLRKTIDALPQRTRRKDEDRPFPMVPRTAPGGDDEHDHEHEEDE
ncbi:MAG TPA: hypothetical protein VIH21_12015 [Dehalococcoidia bacterium]